MSTIFRPLRNIRKRPAAVPKEKEKYEEIEQALQKLAREGQIVDTGRRRWSKRTRSYQIVWAKAEVAARQRGPRQDLSAGRREHGPGRGLVAFVLAVFADFDAARTRPRSSCIGFFGVLLPMPRTRVALSHSRVRRFRQYP